MANRKVEYLCRRLVQANSIRGVECFRKLQMENKSPGLVSRDFREGDFRGSVYLVWTRRGRR